MHLHADLIAEAFSNPQFKFLQPQTAAQQKEVDCDHVCRVHLRFALRLVLSRCCIAGIVSTLLILITSLVRPRAGRRPLMAV